MNKKYVLSFILFFILFILVVGSTYAVISYSNISSSINTISTNQVSMSFIEPSNTITINNALPEYDSFGKASSNYFEFDISAYANTLSTDDTGYNISYSIILRKVSVDSGKTSLSDSNVKVYLTRVENNSEVAVLLPTKVSSLSAFGSNKLIYSSGFNFSNSESAKSTKYRLRFWVSEDTNSSNWNTTSKYQYKFKVDISGEGVKVNNILPNEYQRVNYIASSGTQYIDTLYVPNGNTKVVSSIYVLNTINTNNFIYGSRTNVGVDAFAFGFQPKAIFSYGSNNVYDTNIVYGNTLLNIEQTNKLVVNGNLIYSRNYSLFSGSYNITLFALNQGGSKTFYSTTRIYKFMIYDKNKLVRNMVPCYRKSDNVIGMYDTVNGVFYTNKGTGTFKKGSNI